VAQRETPVVTDTPLFSFEGVRLDLGGICILDGVDLAMGDRQLVAVTGPSGAGKSTLLRLCNRLEVPTAGIVRFRGGNVAGLEPRALRRRVGMVFQRPTPFPGSVAGNLRVADPGLDDDGCRRLLDAVHLPAELLDREAADLSGGEAQRACLARTLATDPEVVLMDEPTSSLDDDNARALEALARDLVDAGVSVIWVSHDQGQIIRIADQVVRMERGRVVSS
jgi:putative ABC transport system ATP-binding protein